MYKIVPWSEDLDLTEFYATAEKKGFDNNANQKIMVDSLARESKWAVWILYYNDQAVGSVGAHSFPEMGENAYRVCARTCVFSDGLPLHHLRTVKGITTHQNATAQFLLPVCIEWAGRDRDLYITSNGNDMGSQRLVHNIFCPNLAKTGVLFKTKDIYYRGSLQTTWRVDVQEFYKQLDQYGCWELQKSHIGNQE
jgi:hypothetical protein